MTLDAASQIVVTWGKYVEFVFGKLMLVFGGQIPESMLPFPKKTLIEALNMVAEYHRGIGNQDGAKALESVTTLLNGYVDDEAALAQAAKNYNDPEWRKAFIPSLKKLQSSWIEQQKI